MFCFIKEIGRSTDILEVFAVLLSDCDKLLQLVGSLPNRAVQDLSLFVLEVFKKMHVTRSVSPSYVKFTSENVFLEPRSKLIVIDCHHAGNYFVMRVKAQVVLSIVNVVCIFKPLIKISYHQAVLCRVSSVQGLFLPAKLFQVTCMLPSLNKRDHDKLDSVVHACSPI